MLIILKARSALALLLSIVYCLYCLLYYRAFLSRGDENGHFYNDLENVLTDGPRNTVSQAWAKCDTHTA